MEAANFAIRYHDPIKGFYQRKKATTNGVVAIEAVAHKLRVPMVFWGTASARGRVVYANGVTATALSLMR